MPEPTAHAWRLQLHGTPRVLREGHAPFALERKLAGLIAYLHRHGATPRGRIASLLWADADAQGARANLRQRLARLRSVVGALVIDAEGLLVLSSDALVEPPDAADAELLGAADYADCDEFGAWLEGEREAERSARQRALLARVRAAVQAGQFEQAREYADDLLALDRESEEPYRVLMEVLYMRGDHAAAIAVWDRCRDMLRGIYGVLPSPATRQLGDTILQAARDSAAAVPVVHNAIPVSVLRPPRLVARAAPLAAMLAAWRTGAALCVLGEGGIGKSRLLAEFAAAVGPCVTVGARPGDALLACESLSRLAQAAADRFEPVLDDTTWHWIDRLLPAFAARRSRSASAAAPGLLSEPLRTPHEQSQALAAVRQLLVACTARGCAAFVFDDLHLADRASLEGLAALLEARDGVALPFALGGRPDELTEPGKALLAGLAATRRHVELALEPLGQAQAVELLECLGVPGLDAGHVAERLVRQIGGNPAHLLESVKLLVSLGMATGPDALAAELPLPPGIEAVIFRRIELLSAPARHIAQLASIAGPSYSVPLVAAALARAPLELAEPLRELEVRQVLYGRQFVHDLVASAVQRSIPRSIADFMHRFVADYLEAHGGEPAPIASHWRACGEWQRAGACYREAAARDLRAARPIEQCEMLDAAAECFERGAAHDELFDVLAKRLLVNTAPDRSKRRLPLIERLEALARNEMQRLQAQAKRLAWASEHMQPASIEQAQAGLARALALGDVELAFEFVMALSAQLGIRGEHALALQAIEELRPWVTDAAEASAPVGLRAEFHLMLASSHSQGSRLEEAIAHSGQAVLCLRADGNELRALAPLSNLGLLLLWRGDLERAKAVLVDAKALRERFHGRGSALLIDINLGAVLRERGEYAAALALLEPVATEMRALATEERDGNTDAVLAENHLAHLWLLLGRSDRALALLATDDTSVDVRFSGRRVALKLRATQSQRKADAALSAALRSLIEQQSSAFNRVWLQLELVGSLEPAPARAELLRMMDDAAVAERPGLAMHVALRLAQVSVALGQTTDALGRVDTVLAALATTTPFDITMSEVWSIASQVFGAAGHAERAAEAARRGRQWLEETARTAVPEALRADFLRAHRSLTRP